MTSNDLPADDHIVRYVKPSMIQEDGTADGSDFRLRLHRPDESGLSVNWLEVFGSGKANQLAEVRRLSRISLRPRGRFAELNVGTVTGRITEELSTLRIVHAPLRREMDTKPILRMQRSSVCRRVNRIFQCWLVI